MGPVIGVMKYADIVLGLPNSNAWSATVETIYIDLSVI